jgi:hypothetical protein
MARSYVGSPRRPAGVARVFLLTLFVLIAFYYMRRAPPSFDGTLVHNHADVVPIQQPAKPEAPPVAGGPGKASPHPIDTLIERAEKEFQEVLKKETHDLKSAAKVYRERRGRHPPPGFDEWFKFAKDNKAVVVEDFFDQIYHDLNPYWGLSPATMRSEGWDNEMTVSIRDHNATAESPWFWTQIWLDLVKTIEHVLPDMDLSLNAMDEPRIVVPWEKITEYVEIERKGRAMPPASEVVSEFQKLPPPGEGDKDIEKLKKEWEKTREYFRPAS